MSTTITRAAAFDFQQQMLKPKSNNGTISGNVAMDDPIMDYIPYAQINQQKSTTLMIANQTPMTKQTQYENE